MRCIDGNAGGVFAGKAFAGLFEVRVHLNGQRLVRCEQLQKEGQTRAEGFNRFFAKNSGGAFGNNIRQGARKNCNSVGLFRCGGGPDDL